MLISFPKRFVFVHIPRCAGNAVTQALQPFCTRGPWEGDRESKHFSVLQIQNHFLDQARWKQFYSFAITRNPWDQIHSDFFYTRSFIRQTEGIIDQTWVAKIRRCASISFDKFVELRCEGEPCSLVQYYCLDQNQELAVGEVLAYEELAEQWPRLCERLGIPNAHLAPINQTKQSGKRRQNYRLAYSRKSRELVAEHFRYDIEKFGYQF